jgi:hypothetical protein
MKSMWISKPNINMTLNPNWTSPSEQISACRPKTCKEIARVFLAKMVCGPLKNIFEAKESYIEIHFFFNETGNLVLRYMRQQTPPAPSFWKCVHLKAKCAIKNSMPSHCVLQKSDIVLWPTRVRNASMKTLRRLITAICPKRKSKNFKSFHGCFIGITWGQESFLLFVDKMIESWARLLHWLIYLSIKGRGKAFKPALWSTPARDLRSNFGIP